MFLLQFLLTFQDVVAVADLPGLIGLEFGLELRQGDWPHSTEWLAGVEATREWVNGKLDFTEGCATYRFWNNEATPMCSLWYRFLIGEVLLRENPEYPGAPEFTVRTIEQCLLALSGSVFLLIMRQVRRSLGQATVASPVTLVTYPITNGC